MGPSGCGKTTLLNILIGFIQKDSGEISDIPAKKSAVFQEDRLCESFNAVSNVRLVCKKNISNDEIRQNLGEIGLSESLDRPVSELSGGMRRRVAIVRAVLADADIIFMDEPFKGLDDTTKAGVIEYVLCKTRGKTVIIVTHSMDEARALGGDIISFPEGD